MDNDLIAGLVIGILVCLSLVGIGAMMTATQDKTIVSSCEKNGYWQTGQTRIICYVEEKNE